MPKLKSIAAMLAAAVMLLSQVAVVYAQDPTPAAPINGTVQSVSLETDATGTTIVVVTLTDDTGATQTLDLSVDTAVSLGLVSLDDTGAPTVSDTAVGQTVSIDPSTVLPPEDEVVTTGNPVGDAIASFFGGLIGLDAASVIQFRDDGMGYGEIAQACWMSYDLEGDSSLCGDILEAKKSGDFSSIVLPDGTTAANWGQFKKAVQEKHDNLGSIMSGHAQPTPEVTPGTEDDGQVQTQNGSNPGNGNGNANGHDKDHKNNGKGRGHNQ